MLPLVLRQYGGLQADVVEALGNAGGFSGAALWRITTTGRQLCVRRWPVEHPTPQRLIWIHSVLRYAAGRGIGWLAVPHDTTDGRSFVELDGHLWELSRWLPGHSCDTPSPTCGQIESAMTALARFHRSVEDFPVAGFPSGSPGGGRPGANPTHPTRFACSPGAIARCELATRLQTGYLEILASAIDERAGPLVNQLGHQIVEEYRRHASAHLDQFTRAARCRVKLQPCLRDIWRDHVLFDGDRVTGFVDYGALHPETVAADVARLLGSLVGSEPRGRNSGLAAYRAERELTRDEIDLVTTLDRGNALLSGFQWLEWLYLQKRRFDHLPRIERRLQDILQRMRSLAL